MAVGAFEELVAWQRARELTRRVYEVTRTRPWARDFGLSGQIQRASVSIMANIAEGNERGSTSEYHHFLCIAKASCAEVRSLLYVGLDVRYLDADTFAALKAQTEEVSKLVGGLRAAIARKRDERVTK